MAIALGVLLDRGLDDLVHGAVVPEVDHLGAGVLEDAAHDVDRRIVSVEERGRRHEAYGVRGDVGLGHGRSVIALGRGRCRGRLPPSVGVGGDGGVRCGHGVPVCEVACRQRKRSTPFMQGARRVDRSQRAAPTTNSSGSATRVASDPSGSQT